MDAARQRPGGTRRQGAHGPPAARMGRALGATRRRRRGGRSADRRSGARVSRRDRLSVRGLLAGPARGGMGRSSASAARQLTGMWYALHPTEDVILLTSSRGLLKVKNLRRAPRMALCVEDGSRYVTLEGTAELVEDRAEQEREVN